jgi:hypothetical protein
VLPNHVPQSPACLSLHTLALLPPLAPNHAAARTRRSPAQGSGAPFSALWGRKSSLCKNARTIGSKHLQPGMRQPPMKPTRQRLEAPEVRARYLAKFNNQPPSSLIKSVSLMPGGTQDLAHAMQDAIKSETQMVWNDFAQAFFKRLARAK